MRRIHRSDLVQKAIVDGLRKAGVRVWLIGQPCDALCYFWSNELRRYLWQPLECKTPYGKDEKAVVDPRQTKQIDFIQTTGTPIVLSLQQALEVLRRMGAAV